jgi:DNA-3-methyladenine glycosylase II
MDIIVRPTAPYDFERVVSRLTSHNEMVTIEDNRRVVRTIRPSLEAAPVLIQAESAGTVDQPSIQVSVIGAEETGADTSQLSRRLHRMFTADMDIGAFYAVMEKDPVMKDVVRRHYGLRLITDSDLFESMVRTIIGQQLTVSFASTLTMRLVELASEPFESEGLSYPVFPSPSQVASLSVPQLRELQFSTRKAEYVIDFARAVHAGTVDLEALYAMGDEEVIETLLPLRGIGRWTVECLLLFGMGRPNLLPAADIGLRNAVRNQYGLDHQASEAEVRQLGEAWAPFRSYATYYLWETLKEKK